jgi:hypothetical protein
MADVDQAVNKIIAETFPFRITEQVTVKGHDWSDEIDDVKDELSALAAAGLSRAEYRQRSAELQDEWDRLDALPAEDDQICIVELGILWSEEYEATPRLGPAGRPACRG